MHLYVGLNIRLHNIYNIYIHDSICMIVYESEYVWHLIMYIIHDSESYVLLIHDNVYIYIIYIHIYIYTFDEFLSYFPCNGRGCRFLPLYVFALSAFPPKIRGAGCQKHETVLGMMAAEPETSNNH